MQKSYSESRTFANTVIGERNIEPQYDNQQEKQQQQQQPNHQLSGKHAKEIMLRHSNNHNYGNIGSSQTSISVKDVEIDGYIFSKTICNDFTTPKVVSQLYGVRM